MLRLAVAVEVAGVRGLCRDADREERQECGDEVGAGVRCVGDEPEAARREAGHELDRDQDDGGGDRDERGAALRGHAGRLFARRHRDRAATRDEDPHRDQRAAHDLERPERLPEENDRDCGPEEGLEVRGQGRPCRPDAVE